MKTLTNRPLRLKLAFILLTMLVSISASTASAEDTLLRSASFPPNNYHAGTISVTLSNSRYLIFRCVYPAYNNKPVNFYVSRGINYSGTATMPDEIVPNDSALYYLNTSNIIHSQVDIAHQGSYQDYYFTIDLEEETEIVESNARFAASCARHMPTADGTYSFVSALGFITIAH